MLACIATTGLRGVTESWDNRSFNDEDERVLDASERTLLGSMIELEAEGAVWSIWGALYICTPQVLAVAVRGDNVR